MELVTPNSRLRAARRRCLPALLCLTLAATGAHAESDPASDAETAEDAPTEATPPVIQPLAEDDPNAETPVLDEFIAVVRAGDQETAGIMARELRERFEGTPRFDFWYAQYLLREERTVEAIFALERVLALRPANHRARLDLARAYFINNNLARSRTEFERVLASDPPEGVQANIRTFLARIDAAESARQRQFSLYAGLETGYDTNINGGGTTDGNLDPNLLGLTELSDSSKAIDSSYGQIRFGGRLVWPTSLKSGHVFGFLGQSSLYPGESQYNQTNLNAQYRLQQAIQSLRAQIAANAGHLWVDGEPWQVSLALSGELRHQLWGPLWGGLAAQTNAGLAQNDANTDSTTDAIGLIFTAEERSRSHRLTSQYVQHSKRGSDDGHLEWKGISNRYNLGWQWPGRIRTDVRLRHDWREYQGDDPLFTEGSGSSDTKRREDQFVTLGTGLDWRPEPWLSTRTGLRFEWLGSNINAYERDRWVISQSLTLTF